MFFLLTSIPVAIGGGCVTFFMAVYCYVSDTTEPSGRALRCVCLVNLEQYEEEVMKNEIVVPSVFLGIFRQFYLVYFHITLTERSMIYTSIAGLQISDLSILILDSCRIQFRF